ncbi:hypothetical protein Tfer_2796 [Thermincola ferriacetica]|uniref:Division initiation protein n=1 Tax=Thermincola ferriacetica TaxID=281456 RepID=A0A0L6VZ67_9FIRM|nr:DUF881 domain-containing protein [Thermincola ferriacetica]KNZ68622.1 hypothetical protein Tfer_2796 [Thermincola ferriacetica]
MKIEKWHVLLSLVCLITGLLIALYYKSSDMRFNPIAQKNQNLVAMIRTQEKKNRELEAEITKIRKDLDKYQQAIASGQGSLGRMQENLADLKFRAGLVKVSGPGIKITLNDQEQARTAKDPEYYMIHYSNILYIVNDLRSAGAEAIAVNGIRVVTNSDIRCAGSIILVNTRRLAPPYVITAIGDPEQLEMYVRSGEYYTLEMAKFPVSLEKLNKVVIPPYKGSYTFNYANALPKVGGN